MTYRERHIQLLNKKVLKDKQDIMLDEMAKLFLYKRVECACGNSFLQKCYRDETPTRIECESCLCLHNTR